MARSSSLKNKFCTYPFEYLEASVPNHMGFDQFMVCCPAWLPYFVGDSSCTPTEIWNSDILQKIRKSILDGTFEYCNQNICSRIQDGFLENKDEVKDPYWRKIIDNEITHLDSGPRTINFANDRSCNLSCPSCRREVIMPKDKVYHQKLLQNNEKLIDCFKNDLRRLIVCSAGDPFASAAYRRMLFNLDGSKCKNLKIQIVTNGLLFTPEVWNKMNKIHANIDHVCISIDAASEEVYSEIRRGGDFKRLLENLNFISELRSQNKISFLQLDFVVQKKNYFEMESFVSLGKKMKVDHVFFQRILNDWDSFTEEEFIQQAVYLPTHPENIQFLKILKKSVFRDRIVKMGNLREFVPVSWMQRFKKLILR